MNIATNGRFFSFRAIDKSGGNPDEKEPHKKI